MESFLYKSAPICGGSAGEAGIGGKVLILKRRDNESYSIEVSVKTYEDAIQDAK